MEEKRSTKNAHKWLSAIVLLTVLYLIFLWLDQKEESVKWVILIGFFICYGLYEQTAYLDKKLKTNSSYRCTFSKKIIPFGSDAKNGVDYVSLHAKQNFIELPFPPYSGLAVSTEFDNGDEFFSGKIENVVWNGCSFSCQVEPWILSETHQMGGVLFYSQEQGWKPFLLSSENQSLLDQWKSENLKESPHND